MSNWVICIGGSVNQVPYIKEIRKMNLKVFLLDKNINAPGKEFSNEYRSIGYDQFDELKGLAKSQFFNSHKIKYVFSAASQFAQVGVSILSDSLNLNFIDKSYILSCLDKKVFYKIFSRFSAPFPETVLINNSNDLKDAILNNNLKCNWYLKSDFGKSPNYIYKINKNNLNNTNIFWGRDRYLSESYLLQKEFQGVHIRVNILNNSFCMFNHSNNKLIEDENLINRMMKFKLFEKLVEIQNYFNFQMFICKFDVIVSNYDWVVIDIGIDPPSRILKLYLNNGINFYELYVKLMFGEKLKFPFFKRIIS